MDAVTAYCCHACGNEMTGVDPKRATHVCSRCGRVHLLGEMLKNRRWDQALSISEADIPGESYVTPGPFLPLPADQPGQVGRYRLESLVGEGGMGRVYAAVDQETGERVALKLIHRYFAGNADFIRRFLREGRLLKTVQHRNLTRFLDLGFEDETYYLAMDFVEGMTLRALVGHAGRLDPKLAQKITALASRGLLEAHRNLIMHRDVKPDNIVVNRRGDVHVIDFGLARNILSRTTKLTLSGQIIGTPGYMAPEQCDGKPADARSDVYALGATLFFALTGRPPFEGTNNWAIMFKHLNEPPPDVRILNPAVSENTAEILGKMLDKGPESRYQTLESVIEDLCLVLDDRHPTLSVQADGTAGWTRFLDSPLAEPEVEKAIRLQEEMRGDGKYAPPLGELVAAGEAPGDEYDDGAGEPAFVLTCPCGASSPLTEEGTRCPVCRRERVLEGVGRVEFLGEFTVLHVEDHRLPYGNISLGETVVRFARDLARIGRHDLVLAFPHLVEFGHDQFLWLFDLFELTAPHGGSLAMAVGNERIRDQFAAVGADNYVRFFPTLDAFRERLLAPATGRLAPGAVDPDREGIWKASLARTRGEEPLEALEYYDTRMTESGLERGPEERDFLVKLVASRLTVLGAASMERKRFRDAKARFDRALELAVDFPPALLQLGRWHLLDDGFREAAEYFNRALEASPDFLPALEHRGGSHFYLDLKERALEDFSRALELNPQSQLACYNMACVYADRGETDTALEWLERAVEFGWNDPDHTERDDHLASLRDETRFLDLLQGLRERDSSGVTPAPGASGSRRAP